MTDGNQKTLSGGMGSDSEFDLEKWTKDYGPLLAIALLILLLGVGSYFGYKAYERSNLEKDLTQVFELKKGSWKSYQDKKISDEEMKLKFTQLFAAVAHKKVLMPLALELAESLHQNKNTVMAIEILAPLQEELKGEQEENFFLSRQLIPLYEDQKDWNKAILLLEENLKSSLKWMEAKNYFDLGRLYRLAGNPQKSKESFQYVVDHFPDDSLARLARLYLN